MKGFLDRQETVSKFRVYKNMLESTFVNEKTGHTVYFGSRRSEVMLRVYDKQLEQKGSECPSSSSPPPRCRLFVTVMGGVVCHYIIKWLDSGGNNDN